MPTSELAEICRHARQLLERLECNSRLYSDHYTNYLNLAGRLPDDKDQLLATIDLTLAWDESRFRPFFIGTH